MNIDKKVQKYEVHNSPREVSALFLISFHDEMNATILYLNHSTNPRRFWNFSLVYVICIYDNLKTWLPCENKLVGLHAVNKLYL